MFCRRGVFFSFGVLSVYGALYNSPSELPMGKSYDYIVIGCTLDSIRSDFS